MFFIKKINRNSIFLQNAPSDTWLVDCLVPEQMAHSFISFVVHFVKHIEKHTKLLIVCKHVLSWIWHAVMLIQFTYNHFE